MARLLARWPLVLALVVLLGSGLVRIPTSSASPISCTTMLRAYEDWALYQRQGKGTYRLAVRLTSNQSNGVAGYAEGPLNYNMAALDAHTQAILVHGSFSGTSTQYFSDRRQVVGSVSRPFSPAATDRLGIRADAQSGNVELTLLSWGGGTMTLSGEVCNNGLLTGWSAPAGAGAPDPAQVTLSFIKVFRP